MLNTNSIVEALRVIIGKPFTPPILREIEEQRAGLNRVLKELDMFHLLHLRHLVESCKAYRDFAEAVEGIIEAYGASIAYLSHERHLKLASYLPTFTNVVLEFSTTKRARLNKYFEMLSKRYFSHKSLRGEDILRVYDNILMAIRGARNYGAYIASGLLYDLTLLRLCSISDFKELAWRPILLSPEEFLSACKSLEGGAHQVLDLVKRVRPVMELVAYMGADIAKFMYGHELLDFLGVSTSSYYSTLSLHVSEPGAFLRSYLSLLRQSLLMRLVLSSIYLGDPTFKGGLKAFIERWVIP